MEKRRRDSVGAGELLNRSCLEVERKDLIYNRQGAREEGLDLGQVGEGEEGLSTVLQGLFILIDRL